MILNDTSLPLLKGKLLRACALGLAPKAVQWSILAFGVCALMLACTTPAEHSNPLDPESPRYTTAGSLRVRVTSFYPPYQALAGARIRLLPLLMEVQSDAEGQYTFAELQSGDYTIVATKAGYDTVQLVAQVRARELQTLEPRLNALPQLLSARIVCARIATRNALAPRLVLEVFAEATDNDGANDVTRVVIHFPGRAQNDTLQREGGPTRWKRVFTEEEIAPVNPHDLVGVPLQIFAEDGNGKKSAPFAMQLARVITEEPLPTFPQNGASINPNNIIMRWDLPALNFDHKQSLEVTRLDAGFPVSIFTASKIEAGETFLPYPGRLASGNYYWTVKIIDSFGNSSRSKEAPFVVQ